jgi:molybdate transport system substrate-binding protein
MKKILFALVMALSIGLSAQTVKVAAAADLRYAMDDLVKLYKKTNPDAGIEIIYGSSGNAYAQILNGAPFDLFFSADVIYPQKLKDAGLTLTEPALYAIGRMVLWSATLDVSKGLSVLTEKKNIRIATANPQHAPYGQRAVEVLKHYNMYDYLETQLVFGENIAQAAQFCLTGNADAGLVALSIALSPSMIAKGKYFLISEKSHSAIKQAYVILKNAKDNKKVFAFVHFLETKPARDIFEKYGFTLPQ